MTVPRGSPSGGDLARREVQEVAQHDDRRCSGASAASTSAARRDVLAARGSSPASPAAPRARVVDRAVDHDAVQPRAERPAAVEAVQRPDRRQERLLGDVLRGRRVVDHQPRGAVRARPVAAEELGHRLGRAPLRGVDQRPLAGAPPRRRAVTAGEGGLSHGADRRRAHHRYGREAPGGPDRYDSPPPSRLALSRWNRPPGSDGCSRRTPGHVPSPPDRGDPLP